MVLGKGHESGQDVAGVVHPFDDRERLRAALVEHLSGQAHSVRASGDGQVSGDGPGNGPGVTGGDFR